MRIKGKGTFVAGRNGTDILHSIHSGFKGIVGIIFPSITMPVESLLFFRLQSRLHERGYQTLIRVTEDKMEKEIEAIRMFQLFGVRGFVIFPVMEEHYNEEILKLSLDKTPHVLVDRYLPNITNSSVTSENIQGTLEAMDYLFRQGHEHIALLNQESRNSNTHERALGFERAFLDRQLPIDKKYWLYLKRTSRADDERVKSQIAAFFKANPHVTAVFAVDTVLARLAYAALGEMGRRVPQDVALVSFDDPKLPFVPYIQQDIDTIADKAADFIIEQMEDTYVPRRETVPVKFVADVGYPTPGGL